jgi:hypothetical protein
MHVCCANSSLTIQRSHQQVSRITAPRPYARMQRRVASLITPRHGGGGACGAYAAAMMEGDGQRPTRSEWTQARTHAPHHQLPPPPSPWPRASQLSSPPCVPHERPRLPHRQHWARALLLPSWRCWAALARSGSPAERGRGGCVSAMCSASVSCALGAGSERDWPSG